MEYTFVYDDLICYTLCCLRNTGVQSPLVSKTLGTPTRPEDGGKQTVICL